MAPRPGTGHPDVNCSRDEGDVMSALVVIVCDSCGDQGTVGTTPQEARAALDSWTRRRGLDLCPLCRLLTDSREELVSLGSQH